MDPLTAQILAWDVEHLTAEQLEFLHALRNQAQRIVCLQYVKNRKGVS